MYLDAVVSLDVIIIIIIIIIIIAVVVAVVCSKQLHSKPIRYGF